MISALYRAMRGVGLTVHAGTRDTVFAALWGSMLRKVGDGVDVSSSRDHTAITLDDSARTSTDGEHMKGLRNDDVCRHDAVEFRDARVARSRSFADRLSSALRVIHAPGHL